MSVIVTLHAGRDQQQQMRRGFQKLLEFEVKKNPSLFTSTEFCSSDVVLAEPVLRVGVHMGLLQNLANALVLGVNASPLLQQAWNRYCALAQMFANGDEKDTAETFGESGVFNLVDGSEVQFGSGDVLPGSFLPEHRGDAGRKSFVLGSETPNRNASFLAGFVIGVSDYFREQPGLPRMQSLVFCLDAKVQRAQFPQTLADFIKPLLGQIIKGRAAGL